MSTRSTCVRCGQALPPEYDSARPCPACLFALGLGPLDEDEEALLVHTGSGEATPPPSPQELAALFPQLEIIELLGQGGMGAVYRARQTDLDRDVALKILSPRADSEAAFAERFAREARALAKLSHPNIVAVHDFGRSGPHYFLMMELVEGTNLRHLIHTKELSSRQALEVVEQVCSALQYAHDEGVVHRDIKPENILIDRTGRAKIADFGLAKMARAGHPTERLTRTRQAMGTPQYMAPEQIERPLEVDHRADIYSLGVVFYELLTGELPLGRFAPPSRKVQVDVRLDEVVLRTLEKEPEQRYQQASHVATDLDGIKRNAPAREPEAGREPREKVAAGNDHGGRRHSWGWIVALLVMVVLLPGGCLALVGFGLASRQQTIAVEGAPVAAVPAPVEPSARSSAARSADVDSVPSPRASANRANAVEAIPAPDSIMPTARTGVLSLVALAVIGVILFVGIVGLVLRGLLRRGKGGRASSRWGWVVALVLLFTCLPLGCFTFLLPVRSMRAGTASQASPFVYREFADPTPNHSPAPPKEPAPDEAQGDPSEAPPEEQPMLTDEEIQRLYEEEIDTPAKVGSDPYDEER